MKASEKNALEFERGYITAQANYIIDYSKSKESIIWAEIVLGRMRDASMQSCKRYKASLVKHLNF